MNEQEAHAVVPSVLQITPFVPAEIATLLQAHPEKYIQPAEPSNQGTAHNTFTLPPLTSTIPFALLPSKQALSEARVNQASSKDAASTMPSVDAAKELSAVPTLTPSSSATFSIHDKVAGSQKMSCSSENNSELAADSVPLPAVAKAEKIRHMMLSRHRMVQRSKIVDKSLLRCCRKERLEF